MASFWPSSLRSVASFLFPSLQPRMPRSRIGLLPEAERFAEAPRPTVLLSNLIPMMLTMKKSFKWGMSLLLFQFTKSRFVHHPLYMYILNA
ncbi:hypothetical protein BDN72DRAFT_93368 [Pluteus cervinus]|uniref:Uncharacterized protein n=1 Tax=Pluteus cervinus TaxID=181527 RepID=A0ACD3APV3_9AGAR|nr:hypothetical protein BDN72DRAFT_93368 [Pluteus cervinus]